MNLAIGILILWIACALLWVAVHGADVKNPYDAFKKLLGAISGAVGAEDGGTGGGEEADPVDVQPAAG